MEGNRSRVVNDTYSEGVCDLTDKEKVKRYEKALKDIVENADKFYLIEIIEIAKNALNVSE
jgi:hypothetical protein